MIKQFQPPSATTLLPRPNFLYGFRDIFCVGQFREQT